MGYVFETETYYTIAQVTDILRQHGILSISDEGTGSSFLQDNGIKDKYEAHVVLDWLGY